MKSFFILIKSKIANKISFSGFHLGKCAFRRARPPPTLSVYPGREEAVVITDDEKTIVCWHPEPQVPYHLTKVSIVLIYFSGL